MFTATLRVRLGSCLSTALKMDNLDCTKINAHFKKFTACLREGAHSRLLVHIASPTSPPYVGTHATHSSVPHTATVEMPCLRQCSTNGKLRILVKAQPAPQAPGHCHQLGLAYGRETWVYPTNTLSATVAFLLLPDTNLLPQAGITHYSQLLTRQHSTKLLLVSFFFFFFFKVDLSLSSKFQPPHEGSARPHLN